MKVSGFLDRFIFSDNRLFDTFRSNCLLEFSLLLVDALTNLTKFSGKRNLFLWVPQNYSKYLTFGRLYPILSLISCLVVDINKLLD